MLTSRQGRQGSKPYYLYACRGMGIEVLPPDVNDPTWTSPRRPATVGDPLRTVGRAQRGRRRGRRHPGGPAAGGPFESFADFCRRVEPTSLTKRVLESLIFAGAFESLGYTRGGHAAAGGRAAGFERVSAPILAERKAEAAGQFSLFGGEEGVVEIDESVLAGEELDKRLLLPKEKEMLGQFVTDHPLLGVEDQLKAQCTCQITDLENRDDGELVVWAASSARWRGSSRSGESPTRSSGWRV